MVASCADLVVSSLGVNAKVDVCGLVVASTRDICLIGIIYKLGDFTQEPPRQKPHLRIGVLFCEEKSTVLDSKKRRETRRSECAYIFATQPFTTFAVDMVFFETVSIS